jgi:hypothetical protein
MNTGALVDRLNFAYQLTTGKFANQKFDSSRVLAMGLMSEPVGGGPGSQVPGVQAAAQNAKPKYSPTVLSEEDKTAAPAMGPGLTGSDVALHVLEGTLIGGQASAQTNQLIHKQLDQQPAGASPIDTLNLLTALVMGSPEFQLR